MTVENKTLIVAAVETYLEQHPLSQSELCSKSGVNARYMINIRKGDFTIKEGTKTIDIADKWFNRLADFIGFETEKSYWKTVPTDQMKSILATLKDAKQNAETAVITGDTGCGKTFVANLFAQKNPADTYLIKVGSSDNLNDLLVKLLGKLKIQQYKSSKSSKIRTISNFIKALSENGHEPTIIFDEAEYMKQPALCALKELYDVLNGWCALVLIGTDQLTQNIEKLKRKNKAGIPQLYRRIKFRIRALPTIDRSFKDFLNGIETGLKRWLQANCENYGELHDVLVPAMREAERTNQPLTEEFVKMVLGLK
jgi:DNA transposition AAA+ family ATPase